MKKKRSIRRSCAQVPMVNEVFISTEERLGRFFDLLLQIDQRNHPEFYDSQKSRNHSDQTPKRPVGIY